MQEFRVCAECGYQRGFHVFFTDNGEGQVALGLICPNCGRSYDIGWKTTDVPLPLAATPGKAYDSMK